MCGKGINNYSHAIKFFPIAIRPRKCAIKLPVLILLQYNLFLNAISVKKWLTKLSILVYFIFDSVLDQHMARCFQRTFDAKTLS